MHSEKWLACHGKLAFGCMRCDQSRLYGGVLVVISLFKHLSFFSAMIVIGTST